MEMSGSQLYASAALPLLFKHVMLREYAIYTYYLIFTVIRNYVHSYEALLLKAVNYVIFKNQELTACLTHLPLALRR
jgi:hypothetical protein